MAVITFLFGAFALLAWLYFTGADRTAKHLLWQSLWYFVVLPLLWSIPIAAVLFIGEVAASLSSSTFVIYLTSLVLFVTVEEAFKFWASRSQTSGIRVFALVSLFGIFELMLFKPFMLDIPEQGANLLLHPATAIPAVFLHVLTASIYAFHWRDRPWIQLTVCALLHLSFNLAADQVDLGSELLWLALIVPVVGATWLLIPRQGSDRRGEWILPRAEKSFPV